MSRDKDNEFSEYAGKLAEKLPFKYIVIKISKRRQEVKGTRGKIYADKFIVCRCVLGHEDLYNDICMCEHEMTAKKIMNALTEYDEARLNDSRN